LIAGIGVILAAGAFSEELLGSNIATLLLVPVGAFLVVYSPWMMNVYSVITNNKAHLQGMADEKAASERFKAKFNYWHIIAIIALVLAALYLIHTLTGGEGWISELIDRIIR